MCNLFPGKLLQVNEKDEGRDHNVTGVWEQNITGRGVVISIVDDGEFCYCTSQQKRSNCILGDRETAAETKQVYLLTRKEFFSSCTTSLTADARIGDAVHNISWPQAIALPVQAHCDIVCCSVAKCAVPDYPSCMASCCGTSLFLI